MSLRILHASQHSHHLPALAEWHHREWAHLYRDWTLPTALSELQSHRDANAIADTTWLALDEDTLLGSVSLLSEDAPALAHLDGPWLASLWVHPAHRRQGLGAYQVNHVRQHARQHQLPRLRLFTVDGADWYRRLGWQDEQTAVLNGSAVTIMHCAPAIETGLIAPP